MQCKRTATHNPTTHTTTMNDNQINSRALNPKRALGVMTAIINGLDRSHNGRKIHVRFDNVPTAHVSGSTVTLPTPSSTMTRGEWRRLNGFVDHEVSHVIWSDMQHMGALATHWVTVRQGKGKPASWPALHAIMNVVEDARINRLAIREWPGAGENLAYTYDFVNEQLVKDSNFIDGPAGVLNYMHANLEGISLDGITVDPNVRAIGDKVTAMARATVMANLHNNNRTAAKAVVEECIRIYQEIGKAYVQEGKPPEKDADGEGEGTGNDASDSNESTPSSSCEEGEGKSNATSGEGGISEEDFTQPQDGTGNANGDQDGGQDGEAGGQGKEGEEAKGNSPGSGCSRTSGKPGADALNDELAEAGAALDKAMNESANMPKMDKHGQVDASQQEANNEGYRMKQGKASKVGGAAYEKQKNMSRLNANASRAIMPKGFFQKIRRVLQSESLSHRRGALEDGFDLDMERVPLMVAGAPIVDVFENKTRGKSYSTAVNVCLDGSGSMCDVIRQTIQDSIAIALGTAFRQNNIMSRFTVMGTGNERERLSKAWAEITELKGWEDKWSSIAMPNIITAGSCASGGTPIAEAFFEAMRAMMAKKADRKIMMFITDGEISGTDGQVMTRWLPALKHMGIEIVLCSIYAEPAGIKGLKLIEFPHDFWSNPWPTAEQVVQVVADQIPALIHDGARALMSR